MAHVDRVPKGMHTVTPQLICAGASQAIEFYKKAFGAAEASRIESKEGKLMHAMIRVGDSGIMLSDEMPKMGSLGPKALKGSPVTIHLYVDDADEFVKRAESAGAKVTMPVSEQFWGDRYGQFTDPFGHSWSVGTHVRDVSARDTAEAAKKLPM